MFKIVLELFLPHGVGAILKSALFFALSVQLHKVDCQLAHGFAHFFFFALELFAAQLVESGTFFTDELLQIVHLIGGNVERVAVLVFENYIFLFKIARFENGRAFAKSNAVHSMHHVVARNRRKSLFFGARKPFFASLLADALGHAHKTHFLRGIYHARFHFQGRCKDQTVIVAVFAVRGKNVVFSQALDHALCPFFAAASKQRLCAVERERAQILHDRVRIEIIFRDGFCLGLYDIFRLKKLIAQRKRAKGEFSDKH